MAGRGPAPKHERVRDRDTSHRYVVDGTSPKLVGKPLPRDVLPDGESWHPQTVAWWNALRRWRLLENEPDVGWQFLLDTALLHHQMWQRGRWEYAAEVRLRVAKFGATPEDRARLKITIRVPDREPAPVASSSAGSVSDVTSLTSRRARLTAPIEANNGS